MTRNRFRVVVVKPPDRVNFVAEIWVDDEMWAEVANEGVNPTLEIYPRASGEPWRFGLREAEDAVKQAKKELFGEDT